MFAIRSAKVASMAVAAAAAAVLTGCSAEVHVGTVQPTRAADGDAALPRLSAEKLNKKTAETLAKNANQPEPTVTCPGDLLGKVGTTMRCQLVATDGSSLGLTLTVTSVQGTDINYNIKVDDLPGGTASATP
ncbi:hypothetical protein GCM10009759_06410 [Kitasatospora saccharophila]|uniref:DUF4333 domain-containing protein n=2 Tax=Kitasatospora saccharophila TaxID=407973 RepID=A0ABN2W7X4_9ACTN